jgi:uncharacterized protein (TIGR02391 family)
MSRLLSKLEWIARNAYRYSDAEPPRALDHPFDVRDMHPKLPAEVRRLFDNGHYSQATFEAFKYLDNTIKHLTGVEKTGKALMMEAFRDVSPLLRLTPMSTETERVEQEGYKFVFAGSMMAIRNPRGHEHSVVDDVTMCLDHLSLASQLLRRLEKAGYTPP